MRTSFHHQSEAQPPNGTLTAATSPDTPSYMASQAVGSPMIGCPSPLPAAGVSLTHVALAGGDEVQAGCISAVIPTLDLIAFATQ